MRSEMTGVAATARPHLAIIEIFEYFVLIFFFHHSKGHSPEIQNLPPDVQLYFHRHDCMTIVWRKSEIAVYNVNETVCISNNCLTY